MRCRHEWSEVKRRYTPPVTRTVEVERASADLMERVMFGFTTIELHCVKCGDVEGRVLLGNLREGAAPERPAWKEERDRMMREGEWGSITG